MQPSIVGSSLLRSGNGQQASAIASNVALFGLFRGTFQTETKTINNCLILNIKQRNIVNYFVVKRLVQF